MTSTPPPQPMPGPIWPPDWSQFVPDGIAAIFTGAIVGVVLWRVGVAADRRRDRHAAEAEWAVSRIEVARTMRGSITIFFPDRVAKRYTRQWRAFRKSLDPRIAVWAHAAPRNRELQLAYSMLKDLPKMEEIARHLYDLLYFSVALRTDEDDEGRVRITDHLFSTILTGKDHSTGVSGERRWRRTDGTDGGTVDELRAEILGFPPNRTQLDRFVVLHQRIWKNWNPLVRSLEREQPGTG